MNIVNSKNRIVERIVQDKNGVLFRAWFLVVEREGRFYGRLIRAEKIEVFKKDSKNKKCVICLPSQRSKQDLQPTTHNLRPVVSPFILNLFFTSQMTRAPSK